MVVTPQSPRASAHRADFILPAGANERISTGVIRKGYNLRPNANI
jgi:hypothetical protein